MPRTVLTLNIEWLNKQFKPSIFLVSKKLKKLTLWGYFYVCERYLLFQDDDTYMLKSTYIYKVYVIIFYKDCT